MGFLGVVHLVLETILPLFSYGTGSLANNIVQASKTWGLAGSKFFFNTFLQDFWLWEIGKVNHTVMFCWQYMSLTTICLGSCLNTLKVDSQG